MAEANPDQKTRPEIPERYSEGFFEHTESIRTDMLERSKQAQRSRNQVTVFLYGGSGDGKSSTLNHLFNSIIIPTGKGKSVTRNIIEYGCSVENTRLIEKGLNLSFIDTPGLGDTKDEDADANNLSKISHFIDTHPELRSERDRLYPNIVLIVASATDKRLGGIHSNFSRMLHVLTKLSVVDSLHPNVVIVVTNAMHFTKEEYSTETKDITEICEVLARAHLSIRVPVVFIENLYERNSMEREGDWHLLPDGTRQPLNLFDAMIKLMQQSGDEVGVEAIRLFFSESGKYPVKETRSNPSDLDLDTSCWKRTVEENFFSKKENKIYSIIQHRDSSDDLTAFPLVYQLQKNNLVQTSDFRNKNLSEIKRLLYPFQLSQQETELLIRIFNVSLFKVKIDYSSLGLGYSRQLKEKRMQVLEIGPLESVKIGNYEILVPKHSTTKDLRQITIDIIYDKNMESYSRRKIINFRICYILFQVELKDLEKLYFKPRFISSLKESLPREVDPDNLEYKFESHHFPNFVKDYGLHCTTGLYYGGSIEGDLYFHLCQDEKSARDFLAGKSANLLKSLEKYFACIQTGITPNNTLLQLDNDISKALLGCNLICKGGNKEIFFRRMSEITVNRWNKWINSIGEDAFCLDKIIKYRSLYDVLSSSTKDEIRSYAPEFVSITTGKKQTNPGDLRFCGSFDVTAELGAPGSEVSCQEGEKKILTRIEAANLVEPINLCSIL